MASSAADAAVDIAGDTFPEENGVISSIRVGLVTGQAVDAALAHQIATAHQRSREATRCTFAADGERAKNLGGSHPFSAVLGSPIRRPLGTGLKFQHKFLRTLPQPFVPDLPPVGGTP